MSEPPKGELKAEPGTLRQPQSFYDDPAGILARHAHEPASLEFHIYKTHYKFSNQEGIIPCNNAAIGEFLLAVAQGVILPAATEVFRDSGVRVFESCYILKIVDHRSETSSEKEAPGTQSELKRDFKRSASSQDKNMTAAPDKASSTFNEDIKQEIDGSTSSSDPKSNAHSDSTGNSNSSNGGSGLNADKRNDTAAPNSYRILLRPTSLTLWHDMLYTTDASQGRFSDQLALSMESEYLNLTMRSMDLRVPPKSYRKMAALDARVRGKNAIKRISKAGKPIFRHRLVYPLPTRKLHEDLPQQDSSTYDDLMTILDERKEATTSNSSNQFMRLACIEQIKKKAAQTQAATKAAAANPAAGQPGKLRGLQGNGMMNPNGNVAQQQALANGGAGGVGGGMGLAGPVNTSAGSLNATAASRYNNAPAAMQGRYNGNSVPDQESMMGRQSLNQSQAQQMAEIRARQDQARQRMARSQAQQAQQMAQNQSRPGMPNMQRDIGNVDRSSMNDMRAMLQRQQHARQVQQQQMQGAQQAQKVQQQTQQSQQVPQQANTSQMSQGRSYMMPQMPQMSPHPGYGMPGNSGGHTSQSPMPNEQQMQSPGQFDNMNFPPQMMR